jgi:hypothetical protein
MKEAVMNRFAIIDSLHRYVGKIRTIRNEIRTERLLNSLSADIRSARTKAFALSQKRGIALTFCCYAISDRKPLRTSQARTTFFSKLLD